MWKLLLELVTNLLAMLLRYGRSSGEKAVDALIKAEAKIEANQKAREARSRLRAVDTAPLP